MSLLLSHPSKLWFRKPVLVRSSPLVSDAFSTSVLQTPPCYIVGVDRSGAKFAGDGKLVIMYAGEPECIYLDKRVPMELVTIVGSSHGWVATLKEDGILRLQDDLNPAASYTDPKHIPLPPLVTLPHCQTHIVTNVAMSSSSPEDEDCVVAVKFLGPQLSFCRPAQRKSKWINIRIANPCFFSSRVMFSKRDDMFRIPGSGGHLIGSWDLRKQLKKPKLQSLRFRNLPGLTKTKRELLDSCCKSDHLLESRTTGETFLVKWYKKTTKIIMGVAKMKTKALMVFKLDQEGNAVYTDDIGDLAIFLSKSEPFCVTASSFSGIFPNEVVFFDVDEVGVASLDDLSNIFSMANGPFEIPAPYHIPPQNIEY